MISPGIRGQLRLMLADHDAARAVVARLYERREELQASRDQLVTEIARLTAERAARRAEPLRTDLADVDQQIAALDRRRATARQQAHALAVPLLAIAGELGLARAGAMQQGTLAMSQIRSALALGPGDPPRSGARTPLDLSHPAAAPLVSLREQIGAAWQRRNSAARAPLATADLRRRVAECIDASVRHASLDRLEELAYPPHGGIATAWAFNLRLTPAELVLLDREAIEDRIVSHVQALIPKGARPATAARAETIASADAELAELESEEETIILDLEDAGRIVVRRTDLNAATVVAVWREKFLTSEANDAA